MLADCALEHTQTPIHRFANLSHCAAFAKRKGLTDEEVSQVIELTGPEMREELINGPFTPKFFQKAPYLFGPQTRYSDGSWPTYYAALETQTAEQEVKHHYGRDAAGNGTSVRPVFYSVITCSFDGSTIDLRPMQSTWPNLVAEDYEFCQEVGKEAVDLKIGGLLAPSARVTQGTNLPVFVRSTLSEPRLNETFRFDFDAITGMAVVQPLGS